MFKVRQLSYVLLLLMMVPALTGCFWVVAGVGAGSGVGYYKGELKKTEPVSLGRLWSASIKGLKAAKLALISKARNKGEIIARTRADEKVTIKLTRIDAKETEISIRVGIFGDQELSVAILEKIKKHL